MDQEKSRADVERALRRVGHEVGEEKCEADGEAAFREEGEVQLCRGVLVDSIADAAADGSLLACRYVEGLESGGSSVDVLMVGRFVRMVATGDMVVVRVMAGSQIKLSG